jgi:hypothetical protein
VRGVRGSRLEVLLSRYGLRDIVVID